MSAVRIRSSAPDPFHGLRGRAYIDARGLDPKVSRRTLRNSADCSCATCMQLRMLPAVQSICDRRQHHTHQDEVNWRDVHNEHAHDLLDVPTIIGR